VHRPGRAVRSPRPRGFSTPNDTPGSNIANLLDEPSRLATSTDREDKEIPMHIQRLTLASIVFLCFFASTSGAGEPTFCEVECAVSAETEDAATAVIFPATLLPRGLVITSILGRAAKIRLILPIRPGLFAAADVLDGGPENADGGCGEPNGDACHPDTNDLLASC